jgi:general secretion pathway protein D
VPIERLNAILVITHQPKHMAAVRRLIEQFDWGTESAPGRRLYVYYLKYGKAENISGVLQELFGQVQEVGLALPTEGIAQLPPGVPGGSNAFRTARQVSEPPPPVGAPGAGGDYPAPAAAAPMVRERVAPLEISTAQEAIAGEGQGPVTIMADQDNNAILIMASPADYRMIEAAIRKLDIQPRQVLINAIISEVTLNDELDYGVSWFLRENRFELGFNTPLPGGASAAGEGLALAIFNSNDETRLFFDLLANKSDVKFISAPQVMVRDNQTATIRVGDQIPVTTRSSQSTTDPDAPIVTEVQFRDTGTLLTVTPRINAGGQVSLDISQEVSLPGTEPAVGGGGNVAIAQRTIDSSVTIHNGQTVVLGGLIRETRTRSKSGIPVLMDIPWLGQLFSTNADNVGRTELIVTINPVVVENQRDAELVTDELRRRMKNAYEYETSAWEWKPRKGMPLAEE